MGKAKVCGAVKVIPQVCAPLVVRYQNLESQANEPAAAPDTSSQNY